MSQIGIRTPDHRRFPHLEVRDRCERRRVVLDDLKSREERGAAIQLSGPPLTPTIESRERLHKPRGHDTQNR
jgi:hypothetical protein